MCRPVHKALSGRLKKSDRGDAEGLAHLARTGWFNQIHICSETSERISVLISTRECLIKVRKVLEGHTCGVLKVFWVCVSGVHRAKMRQGFRDQLITAGAVDPAVGVMVDKELEMPEAKLFKQAGDQFASGVAVIPVDLMCRLGIAAADGVKKCAVILA